MEEKKVNKIDSYLTYKIGDEFFAASVKHVINILEMTKITHVPKSPAYMKGVINLRGSVLPVIDTRTKFGLEETEATTNTCILVLELKANSDTIRLGAIVDSVQEVLEINEDDIQDPPSLGTKFQSEYLTGMVRSGDRFIMLMNINKVFGTDEIVQIEDFTNELKNIETAKE